MESIVNWLKRLDEFNGTKRADTFRETFATISLPGDNPLNLDGWLMAIAQYQPSMARNSVPGCTGLLRFIDSAPGNGAVHHRLVTEIASAITLATGRLADMQYALPVRVEGQPHLYFLPWSELADRASTGPLSDDAPAQIKRLFAQLRGLSQPDQKVIGAAATLHHGALLLVDRELRAAYTLLVAGIEVLSREFGDPPTDWGSWDQHTDWDAFIYTQKLTSDQASALRERLMNDKQLRLKRTFEQYGANRIPATWWDTKLVDWHYTPALAQGQTKWNRSAAVLSERQVRDLVPPDRITLQNALGRSYTLRSQFVHSGSWFGLMEVSFDVGSMVLDPAKPVPFTLLSEILRQLLAFEVQQRSTAMELPKVDVQRDPNEPFICPPEPAAQPDAKSR